MRARALRVRISAYAHLRRQQCTAGERRTPETTFGCDNLQSLSLHGGGPAADAVGRLRSTQGATTHEVPPPLEQLPPLVAVLRAHQHARSNVGEGDLLATLDIPQRPQHIIAKAARAALRVKLGRVGKLCVGIACMVGETDARQEDEAVTLFFSADLALQHRREQIIFLYSQRTLRRPIGKLCLSRLLRSEVTRNVAHPPWATKQVLVAFEDLLHELVDLVETGKPAHWRLSLAAGHAHRMVLPHPSSWEVGAGKDTIPLLRGTPRLQLCAQHVDGRAGV